MGIWYGVAKAVVKSTTDTETVIADNGRSIVRSWSEESLGSTPTSLLSTDSHPSEAPTMNPDDYRTAKLIVRYYED